MSPNKVPINEANASFKISEIEDLNDEQDCYIAIITKTGFEVYKKSNLRATTYEEIQEENKIFGSYESKKELREELPEICLGFLDDKKDRMKEATDEALQILKDYASDDNHHHGTCSRRDIQRDIDSDVSNQEMTEVLEELVEDYSVEKKSKNGMTRYRYVD